MKKVKSLFLAVLMFMVLGCESFFDGKFNDRYMPEKAVNELWSLLFFAPGVIKGDYLNYGEIYDTIGAGKNKEWTLEDFADDSDGSAKLKVSNGSGDKRVDTLLITANNYKYTYYHIVGNGEVEYEVVLNGEIELRQEYDVKNDPTGAPYYFNMSVVCETPENKFLGVKITKADDGTVIGKGNISFRFESNKMTDEVSYRNYHDISSFINNISNWKSFNINGKELKVSDFPSVSGNPAPNVFPSM